MIDIKILGTGCAKCTKLYEVTESIAQELGLDYQIEKISDMMKFINYGVMITPALVVNGKLKIAGKVPTEEQIKQFLSDAI